MGEAMRVQFSDLHKTEARYKETYGKGREPRRYAYAAEAEYEDEDWETAAIGR